MVLLDQLQAFSVSEDQVHRWPHLVGTERKKLYCNYSHHGKPVCLMFFLLLNAIGKKRMRNLMTHFQENGLVARIHGNVHRRPEHSLSLDDIESVVRFLLSYVEQHELLLPGRVPGYSQSDIKLLPSSSSKRGIWKSYKSAVVLATTQTVAYSTFCRLWRELLPSIIVMKPMSDLCWHCQQNSTAILRATNCSENEKTKTIQAAEEHLRVVRMERALYKNTCQECEHSVRTHFSSQ